VLLKMAIRDESCIAIQEHKNRNQNKRVRISMINHMPQKKAHNNCIVRKITNNAIMEGEYEMTLEMESKRYLLASSEVNKEVVVEVVQDKAEVMKEQFHIVKYEQIIPNWNAFYAKIWSHNEIVKRY